MGRPKEGQHLGITDHDIQVTGAPCLYGIRLATTDEGQDKSILYSNQQSSISQDYNTTGIHFPRYYVSPCVVNCGVTSFELL